jgi:hypothetical protein
VRDISILVPHAGYGDQQRCGTIMPVERGDQTDLVCNECGAIINGVAAGGAEPTLLRIAKSGGFCSETCPQCGELNTFPASVPWMHTHAAIASWG